MAEERVKGWLVEEAARENLLARFVPRYPRTVADHVTFKPGPGMEEPPR